MLASDAFKEPEIDDALKAEFESEKERVIYGLILEVLQGSTEDKPMKASDVQEQVLQKARVHSFNNGGLQAYEIYGVMLRAAKLSQSHVRSRKGRNGGYFIAQPLAPAQATDEGVAVEKPSRERKEEEKYLWPLVAEWFRTSKEYKRASSSVAGLRGGGIWSNPDVVALDPVQHLGFFDIKIATAEVKTSSTQWRYFFFEAVSHKRFSERSYFVFRSEDSSLPEIDEMAIYAEKYGVGLAVVEMGDEVFNRLKDWEGLGEEERADMLETIVERVPAPFSPISIQDKVDFLKRINVLNHEDIYKFGVQ